MTSRVTSPYVGIVLLSLFLTISFAYGRNPVDSTGQKFPALTETVATNYYGASAEHRIGDLRLCFRNEGTIGSTWWYNWGTDYFTGDILESCEYPQGSHTIYLWAGGLWIGTGRGGDTLVTTAYADGILYSEFWPELVDFSRIVKRTKIPGEPYYSPEAVSEEDYLVLFTDTVPQANNNFLETEDHRSIGIEVSQSSYAWSYANAEDFVIFDYSIRNISSELLKDIYLGIHADPDVRFTSDWLGSVDDISGFIGTIPDREGGCEFEDTVNIAWVADNDGNPDGSVFGQYSLPHVTATCLLRAPSDKAGVSFNWWAISYDDNTTTFDLGPRERPFVGIWEEEWREFGTNGTGIPVGDANRYYQMRNREIDYDQYYTATIPDDDTLWAHPPWQFAPDCADGADVRYLLSCGPFYLGPGEQMPLTIAYVAGRNLHVDPENIKNLPWHPDTYRQNLDFSDLHRNASWAQMVFDNPGVDTDGDGYAGKVRVCCGGETGYSLDNIDDISTIPGYDPDECTVSWYTGDGVPDFTSAGPPPPPEFWLEPSVGSFRVRINGQRSETARDPFTGLVDFEGYRVYIGLDDRESSYSLIASYDREDFNKHVWTGYQFTILDIPFHPDSLRCLYGLSCDDTLFHPMTYSVGNPYFHPLFPEDSIFYFSQQDYNASSFGLNTNIRKTYPDQPYPSSLNPDSAHPDELTDDGYLKYFDYELMIDSLLPTVAYWVNVTAFDFGSPVNRVLPLESSLANGGKCGYASEPSSVVAEQGLKVYVYPNPYRLDADYRDMGFEGRTAPDRPDYRVRAINFANLPAKCTIKIYSLDGDLIREINHDVPVDDPAASHETWNLITRNTQMVTTGLYYWTVEADNGETQIGKLVIIM
ncbi:MAG: hypothetical protein JSV52_05325 [Candidatus Zixiibacteriota bacterium]|nr:MAG: hypothetical protein JSV52_05325 [candidate division Zixibacteria bacterium]